MDKRLQAIQDRKQPTEDNFLKDVAEMPGYYHARKFWLLFSKGPQGDFQRTIRAAVKAGKVRKDWRGKFWPVER